MSVDEKVVIIGSGISGLTAALYTSRANLKPLVISGYEEGGQLTLTTDVENFPGFPKGIMGPELVDRIKKQAEKFKTRFVTAQVEKIEEGGNGFKIILDDNKEITTKTIIIASGASARFLGIPDEKEYVGKGVSTCATCDGFFYKDKEVVIVGGGDSAMEEALFLTKFVKKVHIIHRKNSFRASKIMQNRVFENKKIEVVWNHKVIEVKGDGKKVEHLILEDIKVGTKKEFKTDGMFLAIGHIPNVKFLGNLVDLDDNNYIKIKKDVCTKTEGLFASGDVADSFYRQAITAAGQGCKAAIRVEKYLENMEN